MTDQWKLLNEPIKEIMDILGEMAEMQTMPFHELLPRLARLFRARDRYLEIMNQFTETSAS